MLYLFIFLNISDAINYDDLANLLIKDIETCNLDGETNLKIRQGLPETARMLTPDSVAKLNGCIRTELPNNSLYTFEGTIVFNDNTDFPVGPDQILLRGAQLRNTRWIYGVVVFTGHETKLLKNSA